MRTLPVLWFLALALGVTGRKSTLSAASGLPQRYRATSALGKSSFPASLFQGGTSSRQALPCLSSRAAMPVCASVFVGEGHRLTPRSSPVRADRPAGLPQGLARRKGGEDSRAKHHPEAAQAPPSPDEMTPDLNLAAKKRLPGPKEVAIRVLTNIFGMMALGWPVSIR
jgi:hypothetical protein